jgi:hypothetical protein
MSDAVADHFVQSMFQRAQRNDFIEHPDDIGHRWAVH